MALTLLRSYHHCNPPHRNIRFLILFSVWNVGVLVVFFVVIFNFVVEIVDEDVITMIIVTIIGVWLVECSQTTGLFLREFQSARLKQSPTSSTKTSSLSPIQMQILLS